MPFPIQVDRCLAVRGYHSPGKLRSEVRPYSELPRAPKARACCQVSHTISSDGVTNLASLALWNCWFPRLSGAICSQWGLCAAAAPAGGGWLGGVLRRRLGPLDQRQRCHLSWQAPNLGEWFIPSGLLFYAWGSLGHGLERWTDPLGNGFYCVAGLVQISGESPFACVRNQGNS